jgi:hypothetical protein
MHQPLCPPRPYPTLTKPLGLMAVDFPAKRDQVFARYPLFRSTEAERRRLFDRVPERACPELHLSQFPRLCLAEAAEA